MKRSLVLGLGLAVVLAVSHALAEDKAAPKCPISGGDISKDASVEYKGGKVYFCCNGCPAKFEKDQAKYATKANHQLAVTGQVEQVGCPLSGGKLDPSTKLKVCGIDVCFCCSHCKDKVAKASEKEQCEMVFGDKAFDKAFKAKKSQ